MVLEAPGDAVQDAFDSARQKLGGGGLRALGALDAV